jgi:hypothetical protein
MSKYRFLGEISESPLSAIFGTKFKQFKKRNGLHGLVEINNGKLVFLAVACDDPGKGKFTAFLDDAKNKVKEIVFIQIFNPGFKNFLIKNGFVDSCINVSGFEEKALVWKAN